MDPEKVGLGGRMALRLVMEKQICSIAVKELEAPSTGTVATARLGQGNFYRNGSYLWKDPHHFQKFVNTLQVRETILCQHQGSSSQGLSLTIAGLLSLWKTMREKNYCIIKSITKIFHLFFTFQRQGMGLHSPNPASGKPTLFVEWGAQGGNIQCLVGDGQ